MNAAVSSLACVLIGLVIIGVADDVSAWVWPALVSHMVGCAFSYVAAVPRALYAKPRLHVRFMMAGFYLFVIGTVCLVSVVATL